MSSGPIGAGQVLDVVDVASAGGAAETGFTRVYDLPGETLKITVLNTGSDAEGYVVDVWGRTN